MLLKVVVFASCFLLASAGVETRAAIGIIEGAPPGFETLEAPRPTSITLYYGGNLLGNFSAQFTPSQVAFDHPEKILAAIPYVEDEAAVGSALASPLATNQHLVCGERKREGCGMLKPKVAGIIFNENKLVAELFISRDMLGIGANDNDRYLPLPERKLSSVYRFDGALSGTDSNEPNYTLSNNAVLAFGEGFLAAQTTVSNRGLRFDTANIGIERYGWSAAGGLMRSLPMQLASDRDMAGISIGTSMRTLRDAHKIEGNDIIVYLPRRAFISIYREGRLYSSRSYEAGNQRIDTTELPSGAYPITLRIQEVDGGLREETRFFAKSEQIPPQDDPTYFFQIGALRKAADEDSTLPEITGKPLARAGTVHRVAENMGISAGVLGLSDRAVVETGLFMIDGGAQARVTALGSTRGDKGIQAGLLYIYEEWSATADARKLVTGEELPDDYAPILSKITQMSASLSYMVIPELTLSARGSYSDSGFTSTSSYGPAVLWRMWQEGESTLFFSASAARVNREYEGIAAFRLSYRFGDYGVSSEAGGSIGHDARGAYGSTRLWHDHTTPEETLLLGAGVQGDKDTRNINADGDWRSPYGTVQGSVQKSFGDNGAFNYGGNFSLGAAQADDAVYLGGRETNLSAISVEAEGSADVLMTIYINGTPRGSVRTGERQVFYLAPYNIYHVRLTPAKAALLHVEGGERKITLYPGNVARLNWRVDPFTVVAGRIVDADGEPVIDALLEDTRAATTTDETGRFQAELTQLEVLRFTRKDQSLCLAALPKNAAPKKGILLLSEPLTCRTALPEEKR